jgi:hypothetical protein
MSDKKSDYVGPRLNNMARFAEMDQKGQQMAGVPVTQSGPDKPGRKEAAKAKSESLSVDSLIRRIKDTSASAAKLIRGE